METMAPVAMALCLAAYTAETELGISEDRFTINGQPTFLLGISYYGALGVDDEGAISDDLDRMKTCGFNWVRVWATWNAFENNVSAVAPNGTARQPYLRRLQRLCELADTRGMIVDVTVTRGESPDFPGNFAEHAAVMEAIARELKPFRNVYFDVGNERNIGDARHVPMSDVKALIERVHAIDPHRLCTASHGGDIGDGELVEYLDAGVDFLTPHRPRHAGSPKETREHTLRCLNLLEGKRRVPIHYQEPFRRDYGDWAPAFEDFKTDLEAARAAGAAGWCFHNGSARGRGAPEDGRPRRSFDLRREEGRLFHQFDAVELAFIEWLQAHSKASRQRRPQVDEKRKPA